MLSKLLVLAMIWTGFIAQVAAAGDLGSEDGFYLPNPRLVKELSKKIETFGFQSLDSTFNGRLLSLNVDQLLLPFGTIAVKNTTPAIGFKLGVVANDSAKEANSIFKISSSDFGMLFNTSNGIKGLMVFVNFTQTQAEHIRSQLLSSKFAFQFSSVAYAAFPSYCPPIKNKATEPALEASLLAALQESLTSCALSTTSSFQSGTVGAATEIWSDIKFGLTNLDQLPSLAVAKIKSFLEFMSNAFTILKDAIRAIASMPASEVRDLLCAGIGSIVAGVAWGATGVGIAKALQKVRAFAKYLQGLGSAHRVLSVGRTEAQTSKLIGEISQCSISSL